MILIPVFHTGKPLGKHHETLLKHYETLNTLWNITKHSNTHHLMRRYRRSMRRHRRSAQGHRRSARWYRRSRRVSGDCGVGITPQMCNRVTNHGDMGTFSKEGCGPTSLSADSLNSCIVKYRLVSDLLQYLLLYLLCILVCPAILWTSLLLKLSWRP